MSQGAGALTRIVTNARIHAFKLEEQDDRKVVVRIPAFNGPSNPKADPDRVLLVLTSGIPEDEMRGIYYVFLHDRVMFSSGTVGDVGSWN